FASMLLHFACIRLSIACTLETLLANRVFSIDELRLRSWDGSQIQWFHRRSFQHGSVFPEPGAMARAIPCLVAFIPAGPAAHMGTDRVADPGQMPACKFFYD